jgi:hypothetical protein
MAVTSSQHQEVSVCDALDVLKLAIGLNPSSGSVTGEQITTADIDQDGTVSVYDALDILNPAIGITNSVTYEQGKDYGLLGGAVAIDFTGVLLGDVDGSYTSDIILYRPFSRIKKSPAIAGLFLLCAKYGA